MQSTRMPTKMLPIASFVSSVKIQVFPLAFVKGMRADIADTRKFLVWQLKKKCQKLMKTLLID